FHSIDQAEVHDVDRDLRIEAGLELLPHHRFEVAACSGLRGGSILGLLAECVGILARDAEKAAISGNLDCERPAERLGYLDLSSLLKIALDAGRDLDRFNIAREFGSFHVGFSSR